MQPFEILEHTADAILRAHGRDLGALFRHAALGMFTIIGEPGCARAAVRREVVLKEEDIPALLRAWLAELLFLFETTGLFFCEFDCRVSAGSLRAVAGGEPFDAGRHGYKTEIKAVTHHQFRVERTDEGWTATVLFDL